jgi:hypothetical protein
VQAAFKPAVQLEVEVTRDAVIPGRDFRYSRTSNPIDHKRFISERSFFESEDKTKHTVQVIHQN